MSFFRKWGIVWDMRDDSRSFQKPEYRATTQSFAMEKEARLETGAVVVLGLFMTGLLVPVLPVNETYTVDVERDVDWPHGGTATYHTEGSLIAYPQFNTVDVQAWLTNLSDYDAHDVVLSFGLQECSGLTYPPKCSDAMEKFDQTIGAIRAGENKTLSFTHTFSKYYSKGNVVDSSGLVFVNTRAVVTETRTRVVRYETVAQRTLGPSFNYIIGAALAVLVLVAAYRGNARHRKKRSPPKYLGCVNCGHQNPSMNQFCARCGQPISDETKIY